MRSRRREVSRSLDVRLRDPTRPERFDVVNHHVVEKATTNVRIPGSALDEIVLEVGVFCSDNPASIERVVRRGGLLKDICRDANAGAISGWHSEGDIRTLEIELVG